MLIYIILYFTMGLSAYIVSRLKFDQTKKNYVLCLVCLVLLVLILSLRHPSMGNDLRYGEASGYLGTFKRIARMSFNSLFTESVMNYEIGFVIFNKIIGLLSINEQYFLFMTSIAALLPITYMIFKYSKDPLFSFFVYMGMPVFIMMFSGIRQIIAIGICTYSIKFIQRKKLIKFLLAVGLAMLFHYSSFIFFIAYPVYYIKFNKAGRILSVAIIGIVYLFRVRLFRFFSSMFKENAHIDNNGAITLFLVFVLIYIFCFIFIKDDKTESSLAENGFLNIFLIACICQAFGGLNNESMRVGYFFMPSIAIVIPGVVQGIADKKTRLTSYVLINGAFILFSLWSLYRSTWAMAYPYHFFWS